MVHVLSDQAVNIDPLVRVLYFGPGFVLWSGICTLVRGFMVVRESVFCQPPAFRK